MTTVKVKNNEPKVHTIGYAYGKTAGGHGTTGLSIRLLPGINEVDAEKWALAKKHPIVQWQVDHEVFQEMGGSSAGLSSMSVPGAEDLISQTLDRDLLRKWAKTEKRASVLKALEAQIDKTTFVPGRDDADDTDGIDLKPAAPAHALDGAAIAQQVSSASNVAEDIAATHKPKSTGRGNRR